MAEFSVGGFTAVAAAGGRVNLQHFHAFCSANSTDGVCMPQRELNVTPAQGETYGATPDVAPIIARAGNDYSIVGLRAAFVMAPALVQAFEPKSLSRITLPVSIILGDADTVAPPSTNGEAAGALIPGAQIKIFPGVGHYDFIPDCTPAGDATMGVRLTKVPRNTTHQMAIDAATALFGKTMGPPQLE